MNGLKGEEQDSGEKISRLETENQVLRDENHRLRSDNAAALFKLEEQISAGQKYEESQSRFETIFHKSKLGNKIIAPDLRILQVNEVFQLMLGYGKEEITKNRIIEFAHPDFIHHWHELQEELWTKQIPSFQIETCLVRKDGSALWCQVTSITFRDSEATLGYTIVEDISQRKALETELKKLGEYQETIMHMVAHDLKSPINNIISLLLLLNQNLEQLLVAESEKEVESRAFIRMISDTCDKAHAIIEDLLLIGDFKSSHDFEDTDLKAFVDSQLPVLGIKAREKGVEISFEYPEEPVHAHINADKFARVLENLLSNAVKFTGAGGQVTVSLRNEGLRAVLQVSDNGIGIPPELQPQMFDMFTGAGREGTEGETTTGLGLYIVKQIVDMHKGTIRVESSEHTGTSFIIELI